MPNPKVKDMPRKQQMAVKASMAEQSAAKLKKSPAKETSKAAKNLLKAVPNKEAYDRLSFENKKGFNKAAKKAGLPTKNVASGLKMKTSPALAKISASCKAAAKRKFKVYPSAYANMWASKTQKAGKC